MIESRHFASLTKGPHVLFLGAVHGNEVCGAIAQRRLMEELQTGKIKLLKGSITCVPVANPRAYQQGVRQIDQNLNRIFKPTVRPRSYEAHLANILCKLVESCDVMLDIHSVFGEGKPFLYLDFPTKRNTQWAQVLGPKNAVVGWPALYKKLGPPYISDDTTTYATGVCKKDSLLIECGQHADPHAIEVAYDAILHTLRHYGLIAGSTRPADPTLVTVSRVYFRKDSETLANPQWKHLDRVSIGTPLIIDAHGVVEKAPFEGCIIMPAPDGPIGHDWLYYGKI